MGMTAACRQRYLVAMASASSWTVVRSAPLARVAEPDVTSLLRRKQQIAPMRRLLPVSNPADTCHFALRGGLPAAKHSVAAQLAAAAVFQ